MDFSVSSGAPFFMMPAFAPQFDLQAGTSPCQFLANRGRRFLTGMVSGIALSCLRKWRAFDPEGGALETQYQRNVEPT
jgi:hypothetical protein